MGKSRREAKLPLPQDVGDAMLDYLHRARPSVKTPYVFIRVIAPWTPITRCVVQHAAGEAMHRAGVETPSRLVPMYCAIQLRRRYCARGPLYK